MTLKYVDGDLIKMAREAKFDVIVHGCNCFNVMGAGIAKSIKDVFPLAYEEDRKMFTMYNGDLSQAGRISCATIDLGFHRLTVINAYTQYRPGGPTLVYDTPTARLQWIKNAFYAIKTKFGTFNPPKIGIPLLGAGIAGGSWTEISAAIEEMMSGFDVTVVRFKP